MTTAASVDALVESLCGDLSSIRAPRGTELNARSWSTEAPLRMLLNNLDPEVAERPEELVVYGGSGRAAGSEREREQHGGECGAQHEHLAKEKASLRVTAARGCL